MYLAVVTDGFTSVHRVQLRRGLGPSSYSETPTRANLMLFISVLITDFHFFIPHQLYGRKLKLATSRYSLRKRLPFAFSKLLYLKLSLLAILLLCGAAVRAVYMKSPMYKMATVDGEC